MERSPMLGILVLFIATACSSSSSTPDPSPAASGGASSGGSGGSAGNAGAADCTGITGSYGVTFARDTANPGSCASEFFPGQWSKGATLTITSDPDLAGGYLLSFDTMPADVNCNANRVGCKLLATCKFTINDGKGNLFMEKDEIAYELTTATLSGTEAYELTIANTGQVCTLNVNTTGARK